MSRRCGHSRAGPRGGGERDRSGSVFDTATINVYWLYARAVTPITAGQKTPFGGPSRLPEPRLPDKIGRNRSVSRAAAVGPFPRVWPIRWTIIVAVSCLGSLVTPLSLAFWFSAAIVAGAYVGYPVALAVAAWLRPGPVVRKSPITPTVSLVIVAHNEEASLEAKLRCCLELDYPRDRLEIVVASDGSSDATESIALRFEADGVRLLALPGPNGKPSGLNAVVPQCRGDVLVLCDARQLLDPRAVRELVSNLADPTVGAVSGELYIDSRSGSAAGEGVGAYWRYEKLIRRLQSRLDSVVGVTGALWALRRELFRPLDASTILDDVALPMDVVARGYRVVFEPGAHAHDRAAVTPRKEFTRKVRTLTGNYQLVALKPWLLDPRRNRLFVHFVCHKLARLAVPWCLLVALGASFALSLTGAASYQAALALQGAFYLVAIAGWSCDHANRRVRAFSLPYAFALLNLAAASSLFSYLRGRQHAAWRRT
jgi:poly-beta-1,6-N-acetyl-D-glucosamine synthase